MRNFTGRRETINYSKTRFKMKKHYPTNFVLEEGLQSFDI